MRTSFPELIACHHLSKTYATDAGPVAALAETELRLGLSDTLALVGPSGCGKSTLLLLMAGLEKPTTGTVSFKGEPLMRPHREIALVLQDYGLFPWKTVRRNVELGIRIRGERPDKAKLEEFLEELDLVDKMEVYQQQLSGGQKQRVALARALILEPSLLLLDEPFAALDTLTRERLQDLVAAAWRTRGFGLTLVTHNIEEAVRLGRNILVMGKTPGTVLARVSNPSACSPDFWKSEEFYELVRIVRNELELAL